MRYYTEDHFWVEVNGEEATIGISEYLCDEIGDIDSIELPEEEDDFIIGDRIGQMKASGETIELCAPLSGTVIQINEALQDEPTLINDSPEEKGWLCKLDNIDASDLDDMLSEDAYLNFIEKNCR